MFCRRGTHLSIEFSTRLHLAFLFHLESYSLSVGFQRALYWLVNLCFHNAVQICFYSASHLSGSLSARADRRHASCQAAMSAHKHDGNTGFCWSLECRSGFFNKEIDKVIATSQKNKNPKQSKAKMDLIQQKDKREVHNTF